MTFITSTYGKASVVNSSAVSLAASATFTGVAENVERYNSIKLTIKSDVDGASGGVIVEFSPDGVVYTQNSTFTYISSQIFNENINLPMKYMRVKYTNGSTLQTTFNLQAVLSVSSLSSDSAPIVTQTEQKATDAYGRLRGSNPQTLFDIHHNFDINDIQEHEVTTGSGSSVYNANASVVDMTVTGNGDSVIRQSRRRGIYELGTSLLIMCSSVLNANSNAATVTTRCGYYDDNDGVYWQYANDTLSVVERSSVSGSVIETTVTQTNFNQDKLDGTGSSGLNLDASKTHLYFVDMQGLGVGQARMGVYYEGILYYSHIFFHSNIDTTTFFKSNSLPTRFEINSTGGSGMLREISAAVMNEGGTKQVGRRISASRGVNTITINTFESPVIAIRLKPGLARRGNILLRNIRLMSNSGANIFYRIYSFLDVSTITNILTGSSFVSAHSSSVVEYDISSTAITTTTGIPIDQGFFTDQRDFIDFEITGNNTSLTSNINLESDVIVITMQCFGGSEQCTAAVAWEEFV